MFRLQGAIWLGRRWMGGLQEEQSWFAKNRTFIVQQYSGQWVLIKDQSVKGAYPTKEDAFNAGVSMFGSEPFLVEQAVERRVETI